VHISSSWLHTSNWGGEKEHVARWPPPTTSRVSWHGA
jgi:hypothetical protein